MKDFLKLMVTTAFAAAIPFTAQGQHNVSSNMFPGHMCHFYDAYGADTHFRPNGYSANGTRNVSSAIRWAVCPIPRDLQKYSEQEQWDTHTDAVLIVMDTPDAICQLYTRSLLGHFMGWFAPDTIVPGSNGRWTYAFVGCDPATEACTGFDFYSRNISLYCRVPGGGVIETYGHNASWKN
jgi:hypothetical protein